MKIFRILCGLTLFLPVDVCQVYLEEEVIHVASLLAHIVHVSASLVDELSLMELQDISHVNDSLELL